jgi:hypothetical protein
MRSAVLAKGRSPLDTVIGARWTDQILKPSASRVAGSSSREWKRCTPMASATCRKAVCMRSCRRRKAQSLPRRRHPARPSISAMTASAWIAEARSILRSPAAIRIPPPIGATVWTLPIGAIDQNIDGAGRFRRGSRAICETSREPVVPGDVCKASGRHPSSGRQELDTTKRNNSEQKAVIARSRKGRSNLGRRWAPSPRDCFASLAMTGMVSCPAGRHRQWRTQSRYGVSGCGRFDDRNFQRAPTSPLRCS